MDTNGWATVTVVVLASGLSTRFGAGQKLLQPLLGRPLAGHVAQTIRALGDVKAVAVVHEDVVAGLFSGFDIAHNPMPSLGMAGSLRLGAEAAFTASILVCLADMPFVSARLLEELVAVHRSSGRTVATRGGDHSGPPAVFARDHLLGLPSVGEAGARALLADALWVEAHPSEVQDFDYAADFERPSGLPRLF